MIGKKKKVKKMVDKQIEDCFDVNKNKRYYKSFRQILYEEHINMLEFPTKRPECQVLRSKL